MCIIINWHACVCMYVCGSRKSSNILFVVVYIYYTYIHHHIHSKKIMFVLFSPISVR